MVGCNLPGRNFTGTVFLVPSEMVFIFVISTNLVDIDFS